MIKKIIFSFLLCCPFLYAETTVTPCFTPRENCTVSIIGYINAADSEVLVRAYSFTSKDIANALIQAHQRRVKVMVLYDKSQDTDKYSMINALKNAGIPVAIDHTPGIAHNKVMILDKKTVITGSFNFTNAAQKRNTENIVIIASEALAKHYVNDWMFHYEKSQRYKKSAKRTKRTPQ